MQDAQDKFLKGEHALVTGASRGIGRAIAIALASAGAEVALAARDKTALAEVAEIIYQAGGKAHSIPCDMTQTERVEALVPTACGVMGGLSILVNNAGVGIYGPIENATADDWDKVMAVNARAAFLLCRDAIAPMRQTGHGWILNISSVVGHKGYEHQAIYGASKHAMMGFSKVLAKEVQKDNIRVHTLCPGGVDTELVAQARPDLDRSGLMRPEEIAEAVLFFLRFNGNATIDDLQIRRAGGTPWA